MNSNSVQFWQQVKDEYMNTINKKLRLYLFLCDSSITFNSHFHVFNEQEKIKLHAIEFLNNSEFKNIFFVPSSGSILFCHLGISDYMKPHYINVRIQFIDYMILKLSNNNSQ